MKKTIYCLSVILCELLLAGVSGHAQQLKLGNNPTAIDKTALLELESNNQGLLLPRISDTNAFHPNPIPNGMLIYYVGTSDSCLMIRKDGRWVKIVDFVNLAGQETDPVATAKTVSITAGNTAIAVAGGTQTVGNNPNFTLTVPNTNPIWNASQLQGVSISSTSPTTDQLLQYNGTNWVPWTPNYLPASNINGTTNYVSKFTGGNTLGNSIIYDNGKVGIGSTSPDSLLTVNGSGHFTSNLRLDKGLSLAGNYGTANQVLTSNGAGNLPSWSTLSTLETDPTAWKLTGNAGTTPGTNFLGTTDNKDLVFKANNTERMRVSASNGNVGIGTTTPQANLDVNGNFKLGQQGTVLGNVVKIYNFSITNNTSFDYHSTNTFNVNLSAVLPAGFSLSPGATIILNPRSDLPQMLAVGWVYVLDSTTIRIGLINTGGSAKLGTVNFDITIIQ